MNIFDIIIKYHEAFFKGLKVTFELAILTWGFGIFFGFLLGTAAHRWSKYFGKILNILSILLMSIPFLVVLFWVNYPLQELLHVVIDPFYTASAILILLNSIGVSEIARNAFDDFPEQYIYAAKVCGLTRKETILKIRIPLIFRQILPALLNLQVNMLQMTLFASLISVNELFRISQQINSQIHKPVEIYSALGLFFLIICIPLNGIAIWFKRKFTRNISDK